MHQHVVIGFAVVSHQPGHLDLDGPLPRGRHTDAQVAFLATLWVRDVGLHNAGVPSGGQVLKLGDDEGDSRRLWMWANSRLVHCTGSSVGSLRTSSVNALYGDGDIIDQLLELQKGPLFRLSGV
jgi:hypothetical protein